MEVQGENSMCSPCRFFVGTKTWDGLAAPHGLVVIVVYAALGVDFAVGCGLFFAFSLAANSCRTLRPMASVSTL